MSYYGEKGRFSFRDNFCEETDMILMNELADFGELVGSLFKRIAIGTDSDLKMPEISVFSGGAAKGGADIFIIKEPLPVFKYGISLSECECGIYLCGEEKLKIFFFDKYGINMSENIMSKIYNYNRDTEKIFCNSGRIINLDYINQLYINSLRDIINDKFNGDAVISCGNRKLSDIWRTFFSSEKGDVIFQLSEDGSRVNCYSTNAGFISYERLILAYALMMWENGKKVILPKGFHYAAEEIAEDINAVFEYSDESNQSEIYRQRFTLDSLYLCISLMNSGKSISEIIKKIPKFYTARRELVTDFSFHDEERTIFVPEARIKLSRSGKNRLTLTVQSMNMETSAELCGKWERLILERNNSI